MSNKDADRALRALEQRVPEMDDAALDALNAQAYEKFMQRRKRRGRMHRRIAAVCAATLGILVVSFGFSVLMPNKVGQANNGVKKVALWFGEKLHLDLKFDQPVDDTSQVDVQEGKVYYTLEEAANELKIPIVGLNEQSGFELREIRRESHTNGCNYYSCAFQNDDKYVRFDVDILGEQTTASMLNENRKELWTPLGNASLWMNDTGCRAVVFTEKNIIQISSNLDSDQFISLAQYFDYITQF